MGERRRVWEGRGNVKDGEGVKINVSSSVIQSFTHLTLIMLRLETGGEREKKMKDEAKTIRTNFVCKGNFALNYFNRKLLPAPSPFSVCIMKYVKARQERRKLTRTCGVKGPLFKTSY